MAIALETLRPAPLDPAAEQVMVPMRDGVRLATDVYFPARPGRLPAVLVRLPYDKCGRYTFMPQCAPYFTERGYAFVVQDVRGKFRSEGETMPFVHEVDDGYDTLEWVIAQSWSNGLVGMFGDSYYGFTQWAAVASGHPALKAIVPRVTSSDLKVLTSWWGDSVVELYGADYLAHYWVDRMIHFYEGDYGHRPLAEAFDRRLRGDRRARGELRPHDAHDRPAGHRSVPDRPPVRPPEDPRAALGGLVRQHRAGLVRGLHGAAWARGGSGHAVPQCRRHRPRELPPARGARLAARTTTTPTTRRWRACCPCTWGPA